MNAATATATLISPEARVRFWVMDGQAHLTQAEELAVQIEAMQRQALTDANGQAWDGKELDADIHARVTAEWWKKIDALTTKREQHLADALTAARQGREIVETSEAIPA